MLLDLCYSSASKAFSSSRCSSSVPHYEAFPDFHCPETDALPAVFSQSLCYICHMPYAIVTIALNVETSFYSFCIPKPVPAT